MRTSRSNRSVGRPHSQTTASCRPTPPHPSSGRGNAEEPGAWFVTAALGTDRPVWQARFGAHTPAYLVAAFTAALADPKPVLRMDSGRSLPTCDPNVVTRRTTDVLAVYVARALEERVHSLASRHTAPPTGPIPKREPSAKSSRSR
ncbi:DUF317 domain-containing protein [Streptomyces mirabilis]|uniref:DUF317 domain-containing protein n=1 Tax=Streptomyces mirabilis TaxID=68239 RepID=UPI0035D9C0DB